MPRRFAGAKFFRKEIDALTEVTRTYGAKGMAWIAVEDGNLRSSFTKFLTEDEINRILDKVPGTRRSTSFALLPIPNEIVFELFPDTCALKIANWTS